MKRVLSDLVIQAVLLCLGVVILIVGIIWDIGTRVGLGCFVVGLGMSIGPGLCMLFSLSAKTHLKLICEDLIRTYGLHGLEIIPENRKYTRACSMMSWGTMCKATFFGDSMWQLRENERGYEDQKKEHGWGTAQSKEACRYFRMIRDRLNGGGLTYHWLVYVQDRAKCDALVDRVSTAITANTTAILNGNVIFKVLPPNADVATNGVSITKPCICFGLLIAADASNRMELLFTPMITRRQAGDSM